MEVGEALIEVGAGPGEAGTGPGGRGAAICEAGEVTVPEADLVGKRVLVNIINFFLHQVMTTIFMYEMLDTIARVIFQMYHGVIIMKDCFTKCVLL